MNADSKMYDVIVIGVGSMGSAACYYLSSRGVKVLGLEQFDIVHDRGSHTGQTRIIRKAYYEHPDYVPLLERSYELWNEIEVISNEKLFFKTGILYIGETDHPVLTGVKQAAFEHDLQIDLNPVSSSRYRSGINIPAGFDAIFEPDAGYVLPDKTIRAFSTAATKAGADIRYREPVKEWRKEGDFFIAETEKGSHAAKKIIFTAGAWAPDLLAGLIPELRVTRQMLAWVQAKNPTVYSQENFPCWVIADPEHGLFYGFPFLSADQPGDFSGFKIARHLPAKAVSPNIPNQDVDLEELAIIKNCMQKYFPGLLTEGIQTKNCLYTNSADEDFIIDFLPGYGGNLIIACGFSGHGFKFVPVIGTILADMAMYNKTDLPSGFLKMDRFKK